MNDGGKELKDGLSNGEGSRLRMCLHRRWIILKMFYQCT